MDYYNEAKRLVHELKTKEELKPRARYLKCRLKQETKFWSSLYNVDWHDKKIRKEIELIIEFELDKCREYHNIVFS